MELWTYMIECEDIIVDFYNAIFNKDSQATFDISFPVT